VTDTDRNKHSKTVQEIAEVMTTQHTKATKQNKHNKLSLLPTYNTQPRNEIRFFNGSRASANFLRFHYNGQKCYITKLLRR